MTESFHNTGNYRIDHSTFGGTVCYSDFYRRTTLSEVADRIMSDKKFDHHCRMNEQNRQRKEQEGNKNVNDN